MRPEDIQNQDFLVGLRGYDKDEVRSFLAQVASEHAALLSELESAQHGAVAAPAAAAPVPSGSDDFENLGAGVAAIMRAAKDSAQEVLNEAEARRQQTIEAADEALQRAQIEAAQIRAEAQASIDDARAEAERIRQEAQARVADANAEAERVVRDAAERVRQLEIQTEARITNRAEEAARREAAMRDRLLEASEEIQLALVALGDDPTAPATDDVAETNHHEDVGALG